MQGRLTKRENNPDLMNLYLTKRWYLIVEIFRIGVILIHMKHVGALCSVCELKGAVNQADTVYKACSKSQLKTRPRASTAI